MPRTFKTGQQRWIFFSSALTGLLEARLALSISRRRNHEPAMVFRRMVDLGGAPFPLHTLVRFGPRREFRGGLDPVDQGRLVAPLEQLAHGRTMGRGQHKRRIAESDSQLVAVQKVFRRSCSSFIARFPGAFFAWRAIRRERMKNPGM